MPRSIGCPRDEDDAEDRVPLSSERELIDNAVALGGDLERVLLDQVPPHRMPPPREPSLERSLRLLEMLRLATIPAPGGAQGPAIPATAAGGW